MHAAGTPASAEHRPPRQPQHEGCLLPPQCQQHTVEAAAFPPPTRCAPGTSSRSAGSTSSLFRRLAMATAKEAAAVRAGDRPQGRQRHRGRDSCRRRALAAGCRPCCLGGASMVHRARGDVLLQHTGGPCPMAAAPELRQQAIALPQALTTGRWVGRQAVSKLRAWVGNSLPTRSRASPWSQQQAQRAKESHHGLWPDRSSRAACVNQQVQHKCGFGLLGSSRPALLMKSSATARSASSASSVALAFMMDMPRPT